MGGFNIIHTAERPLPTHTFSNHCHSINMIITSHTYTNDMQNMQYWHNHHCKEPPSILNNKLPAQLTQTFYQSLMRGVSPVCTGFLALARPLPVFPLLAQYAFMVTFALGTAVFKHTLIATAPFFAVPVEAGAPSQSLPRPVYSLSNILACPGGY